MRQLRSRLAIFIKTKRGDQPLRDIAKRYGLFIAHWKWRTECHHRHLRAYVQGFSLWNTRAFPNREAILVADQFLICEITRLFITNNIHLELGNCHFYQSRRLRILVVNVSMSKWLIIGNFRVLGLGSIANLSANLGRQYKSGMYMLRRRANGRVGGKGQSTA